jgi:catalase
MKPSDALSIQKNMKPILQGRCVGILINDGSDAAALAKLQKDISKAGAACKLVAPKINGIVLSDKSVVKVDGQLAGTPSQLFDAVAVLLSKAGTESLLKEGAAVQWVQDAFGHLKAIGHSAEAKPLLDKAHVAPDEGVVDLGKQFIAAAAKRYFDREPKVRTLA